MKSLFLAGVNKTMDRKPYDRKGILVRVFCVGASFYASVVLKWTTLFPNQVYILARTLHE